MKNEMINMHPFLSSAILVVSVSYTILILSFTLKSVTIIPIDIDSLILTHPLTGKAVSPTPFFSLKKD